MHCIEENNILKPFTRDTFSSCIKACYAEVDGTCYPIFKDPKDGGFKKSQKGLCHVHLNDVGEFTYTDGYTSLNIPEGNLLEPIFKDGYLIKEYSLSDIRKTLNGGNF